MTARTEAREEWIDMRADALREEYSSDAEKIAEADSWCEGAQDAEWYTEAQRALADLHTKHPDDLLGSDLLVSLYRLAKSAAEARDARLSDMADEDAEDEWFQAGYDKGEELAWDLEDAA